MDYGALGVIFLAFASVVNTIHIVSVARRVTKIEIARIYEGKDYGSR